MATTKVKYFSDGLERFLKSKKLYSKAVSYAVVHEVHDSPRLTSSFRFKDTKEGVMFWFDVDSEFKKSTWYGKKEA